MKTKKIIIAANMSMNDSYLDGIKLDVTNVGI
jgi:hypothetical protein